MLRYEVMLYAMFFVYKILTGTLLLVHFFFFIKCAMFCYFIWVGENSAYTCEAV